MKSVMDKIPQPHGSHELRGSDASTFDYICVHCGHTDRVPGGWGKLVEPCPEKDKTKKRWDYKRN
jgi:hypothetical protein